MFTVIRSLARRIAVVVTMAAAGLGLALSGTASADTAVHAYAPSSVREFTMVSGQQWAAENNARLAGSGFLFTGDGHFAMIQPGGYPRLVGTWTRHGTFQGSSSSSAGYTGSTSAQVQGSVAFRQDGTATIRMTYTSGRVMAANVGGTSFGSNTGKAYHATLELRRL